MRSSFQSKTICLLGVWFDIYRDACAVLGDDFVYRSYIAASLSASSRSGGNARPLLLARLKIPRQASGLKEYLGGGFLSKTSDKEDTAASLGDSEELRVKYPPRQAVPEVSQA